MRTIVLLLEAALILSIFSSCKKDKRDTSSPTGGTPGSGNLLQARIQGTTRQFSSITTYRDAGYGVLGGFLYVGSDTFSLSIADLFLPASRSDTSYTATFMGAASPQRRPQLLYSHHSPQGRRAYSAPYALAPAARLTLSVTVQGSRAEGTFEGILYGGTDAFNPTDSIQVTEGSFRVNF
ncbi:MAG: hypothetical protein RMJ66_03600 [Bacteroidia bacterium]|nr:hypothetical protein [Bacteroidia bacterium]MDW8134132.1 hypothetical protein [Bacteroidia bacterium]